MGWPQWPCPPLPTPMGGSCLGFLAQNSPSLLGPELWPGPGKARPCVSCRPAPKADYLCVVHCTCLSRVAAHSLGLWLSPGPRQAQAPSPHRPVTGVKVLGHFANTSLAAEPFARLLGRPGQHCSQGHAEPWPGVSEASSQPQAGALCPCSPSGSRCGQK